MRHPRADPSEQAQTAAYLAISGEVAEQERTVQRLRSIQRLFFAWLTLGSILLAAVLTVVGALFVKFETVDGRTFYRWFVANLVAASVGTSSYHWWRSEAVRDASVDLAKVREQRRLVLSRGMTDLVGARRRYREEIQAFIEEYRSESTRNRRP